MNSILPISTIKFYSSKLPLNSRDTRILRQISNFRSFDGYEICENDLYPIFRIDPCMLNLYTDMLREVGITLIEYNPQHHINAEGNFLD